MCDYITLLESACVFLDKIKIEYISLIGIVIMKSGNDKASMR